MEALASIVCLSGNNGSLQGPPIKEPPPPPPPPPNKHLDVLAFEAARAVSRLLNLYRSLSDPEVSRLRKEIFKSKGILYLNSDDEGYLLKLACAEKIEDLDNVAIVVDRLGRKCPEFTLKGFNIIYAEVKAGGTDLRKFEYGSSKTKNKIRKLKKFLLATLCLYGSMHTSSHSRNEVSDKKPNSNSPVPFKNMFSFPLIEWMITPTRKQTDNNNNVRKAKLWTQPYEKVVRLMSSMVCVIYARICMVFGPYVPDLPAAAAYQSKKKKITNTTNSEYWIIDSRNNDDKLARGKLIRSKSRKNLVRCPSRRTVPAWGATVFHIAGPETVGGARLQILYANLIMMAEENMTRKKVKDNVRDEMYKMLPKNLKVVVKMKIKSQLGKYCDKGKMKEALKRIFMWLSPMATNTLLWQRERRVEMTNFNMRPPMLLLQTLHFADKEKTEAAIIEVYMFAK
ncbi:protein PSK SIMULATOR 1-like [Bidens hawaiensis]|uniref:protein PSK SIMULATOR 1-like n=1 Tax=Bidens hawaiensis TaxID=980011 RepID=UPI00404A4CC6